MDNEEIEYNPVSRVKKLKIQHQDIKILDIKQIQKLLLVCSNKDKKFYPFLATAILTDIREGELISLTWEDINFKKKQIRTNKSIYKGVLTDPKTYKSIRTVDIPDMLVKILKEWKLESFHSEINLAFPNTKGTYHQINNIRNRHFKPLLDSCGFEGITFHSLRHSYVSLLIYLGVSIVYIQELVGHSSSEITKNVYSHTFQDARTDAVSKLNQALIKQQTDEEIKLSGAKEEQI